MSIPLVPLTPLQVVFTLTDDRLPFRTKSSADDCERLDGVLQSIPDQLLARLELWNRQTNSAYNRDMGCFGSKERRAQAANEYAALAEELWARRLDVRLEMWW
ncbi:hypothetical protein [Micrococcoides hystricis]|uniref:Uncharacterized protein n=1 Tax=Micrococcoides hystricis TaxID=1572761 RepID=A0ABV6PB67_9MICC